MFSKDQIEKEIAALEEQLKTAPRMNAEASKCLGESGLGGSLHGRRVATDPKNRSRAKIKTQKENR